jgi:hypothetical protein
MGRRRKQIGSYTPHLNREQTLDQWEAAQPIKLREIIKIVREIGQRKGLPAALTKVLAVRAAPDSWRYSEAEKEKQAGVSHATWYRALSDPVFSACAVEVAKALKGVWVIEVFHRFIERLIATGDIPGMIRYLEEMGIFSMKAGGQIVFAENIIGQYSTVNIEADNEARLVREAERLGMVPWKDEHGRVWWKGREAPASVGDNGNGNGDKTPEGMVSAPSTKRW